ncbi:MAG: bifunctional (p)ppGpp synthetase/guanosine-3',5'-bis(diphosphate) 3'-pyrophosphohydrolase [Mycoplasmatota bacterium]|nr:bifunctional (p)ppGpp synthetase/guanosine-3',5'-bis(diphosphate) 3'-pyrophosphohydrolase [Mycoplasmatota bacterium]
MVPTSKQKDNITFEDVLEKVKAYIEDEEKIKVIQQAYLFAQEKHEGQFRKSGEPYITHPLNVAQILTTIYADYETISAGLLHDVLEDCDCTVAQMEELFGKNITKLVQGVTKLSKIHFSTENEYLIDYYKKIIVGMSEDVRVIIIKLADRLHNMRTLWATPEDRQKVKAHEALDILAPIAHHLGIHKIKSELEDLSLRYLKPDVFYDIAEKLNKTKIERDKTVYDMLTEVSNLLTEHHIPHEIKGRAKSIYSIYNKLDKGKKFSDIYDLLALRILVNTEQECYLALGIIHSKFRPLPKRFKDYVAMPKPNMYQSLHTTVFGIDGYLFEIQIRTYEMDEVAENGIASHWAYKENGGSNSAANLQSTTEQKLQFFKSIIDLSKENMSSEEFVNSVKDEVLNNNIYVFTPKGDVIELPRGATPIDFAYAIHTKVGETMVGAIVNNNIVPLNYELKDNDIVKINTNKNSTPSKEWLNIVKATKTKNRIKSFFTKNDREVYIERGSYSLEKELRKRKLSISEFLSDENVKKICEEIKVGDLEELYLAIGNGKAPVNGVINIIHKSEDVPVPKVVKVSSKSIDADIIVSGIDKVKVNLANCCNPVYGDPIIGYITKGNGITVHRLHCHNLSMLEDRTLEVKWNDNSNKRYLTSLFIYTNTTENHMLDLMQTVSMLNVNVDSMNTVNKVDKITYEINCYVTGLEQLNKVILGLEKSSYVEKVERVMR